MDKQKQINEIADIIFEALNNKGRIANGEGVDIISAAINNAGYRKIDKNAVVILDEEMEEFAETVAKSPQMKKVMDGLIKAWKKETAEKFAERVKMAFYYEFDELIPSIMADKIDEIAREITDKGVQNGN